MYSLLHDVLRNKKTTFLLRSASHPDPGFCLGCETRGFATLFRPCTDGLHDTPRNKTSHFPYGRLKTQVSVWGVEPEGLPLFVQLAACCDMEQKIALPLSSAHPGLCHAAYILHWEETIFGERKGERLNWIVLKKQLTTELRISTLRCVVKHTVLI